MPNPCLFVSCDHVLKHSPSIEGKNLRKRNERKKKSVSGLFQHISLTLFIFPVHSTNDKLCSMFVDAKFPFIPCVSAWLINFKTWTIFVRHILCYRCRWRCFCRLFRRTEKFFRAWKVNFISQGICTAFTLQLICAKFRANDDDDNVTEKRRQGWCR